MKPNRATRIVIGSAVAVASGLWTLLWAIAALLASAFGGDTQGWLIVSGALAVGVLTFALSVSVVRGRRPSRLGWLAVAGAALASLLLPLASWSEDREADPVNRAVQRSYIERSGLKNVAADCDLLEEDSDGSESWICSLGPASDYDVCQADVSQSQGRIVANVYGCLNEGLDR